MSGNPEHPDTGDLLIDARKLRVNQLTTDQKKKLARLRAGALPALQRVLQLTPEQLTAAGISASEVTRAGALVADYAYAEELLGPTNKLAEMVLETKLDRGDQLAYLITELCGQIRRRVERGQLSAEILGAVEELLEYQLAPAHKARLTRTRKVKASHPESPLPPAPPHAPPVSLPAAPHVPLPSAS